MTTMTLTRGEYSLRDQGCGRPRPALKQAFIACRQFFGPVDNDYPRNQVRHLPFYSWLLTNRADTLAFRQSVREKAPLIDRVRLPLFEAENCFRKLLYAWSLTKAEPVRVSAFTRIEKLGVLVVAFALMAFSNVNTGANATSRISESTSLSLVSSVKSLFEPAGPANWLNGVAELNGYKKDALSGPLKYAQDSGYEFASDKDRLLELVEEGVLVELEESERLKFNGVTRPYVLPVVAEFVYRLADLYYYDQRCGPLWLNGAARDVEYQKTFSNGSEQSVHPTGMAVDFKSTGLEERCLAWLESTLAEIETAKRVDVTKETSAVSPHFHVTVATHEYEAWLARRLEVADAGTDWLRKTLFYEGGPKESLEGFRAIGWVIKNRVRSADYPDTIQAVVAEGSTGKHDGGCQFSFMCDGKAEDRYELCRNSAGKLTSYWRHKCDARWERVTVFAKAFMSETNDPTGGAVLYYTGPEPHWAKSRTEIWGNKKVKFPQGDFKPGTVKKIGSHIFGCSLLEGSDVCTAS